MTEPERLTDPSDLRTRQSSDIRGVMAPWKLAHPQWRQAFKKPLDQALADARPAQPRPAHVARGQLPRHRVREIRGIARPGTVSRPVSPAAKLRDSGLVRMDPVIREELLIEKALSIAMTSRLMSPGSRPPFAESGVATPFSPEEIQAALSQAVDAVTQGDHATTVFVEQLALRAQSLLQQAELRASPSLKTLGYALQEHVDQSQQAGQSTDECWAGLRDVLRQNVVIAQIEAQHTGADFPSIQDLDIWVHDAMLDREEAESGNLFLVAWTPPHEVKCFV